MYVREKKGRLYLVGKIKVNGKWKQKTISINKDSNERNKKWAEKNKNRLWSELLDISVESNSNKVNKIILLKDYGEYVLNITKQNRNSFSEKENRQKLSKLIDYFGNVDITDLKSTTLIKWQNDFLEKYAPKTVRNYRGVLSLIFKFALLDEIISKNPLDVISVPKIKKVNLPNFYTKIEIKLLIDNSIGVFKNILEFAFYSGLRTSELIALKWSDVDFENDRFIVDRRLRDGDISAPKGDKIRVCYLFPQAKDALLRQFEVTGNIEWVWLNKNNEPYKNYDFLDKNFKKLCRDLNIKVGKFYDTRHSFATLMLQSGQSETFVKQHMGHYHFNTTLKHYVGNLNPNLEAINNLKVI